MVVNVPIAFGEARKCIGISVIADPNIEEDETFYVVLDTYVVNVTILDDGTYSMLQNCSFNYTQ